VEAKAAKLFENMSDGESMENNDELIKAIGQLDL
jgi:hypothetical protein